MSSSWRDSKDLGKQAFTSGDYSVALARYLDAIDQYRRDDGAVSSGSTNSNGGRSYTNEHQILLSNVIACRLKIGGEDMARKAVEESKQCIALNDKWPKAHIRLASSYIALGSHSNDACLSLQRALSLDRNNKVAREMLVKEMRRRNIRETNRNRDNDIGNEGEGNGGSNSNHNDQTVYPTEETPQNQHFPEPSAPPQPSHPANNVNNSNSNGSNSDQNDDGVDIDDIDSTTNAGPFSFSQRIQHYMAQFTTWYHTQSDDIQTLFKVAIFFLILYVLLGGRFGLDHVLGGEGRGGIGNNNNYNGGRRGNYGEGNAYERYSTPRSGTSSYSSTQQQQHRYTSSGQEGSSGYNDRTSSQNNKYYSRYDGNTNNDHYYDPPPRARQQRTSYGMPNLYDGSFLSMAILAIIAFACNRLGINPFQVLWMLNLIQRRGHGGMNHRMGRFGYGAYPGGGGFGAGGFGGRRRRFGYGNRRGRGGFY